MEGKFFWLKNIYNNLGYEYCGRKERRRKGKNNQREYYNINKVRKV